MRKLLFLVALLTLALSVSLPAQAQHFSDWSAPVNLGPVLNSPYADQGSVLSRDGLSLYFVSNRPGGLGGNDIWFSERATIESPWETPQNAGPNINSSFDEAAPTLSTDGHRLYFATNRPGIGAYDLWVSRRHDKRDNVGWLPAEMVVGGPMNTTANDTSICFFEDEASGKTFAYFASDRPGSQGGTDIYASIVQEDGTFGPVVPVGELNSASFDQTPTVRRDGLEVIFLSNRPGSNGPTDIWVARRASTSEPWSTPVNLGDVVNSAFGEIRPMFSFDGTELYFGSNRPGGYGNSDQYLSVRTKVKGKENQ